MEKLIRCKSQFGWSEWMTFEKFSQEQNFGLFSAVEIKELLTADEAMKAYPEAFKCFTVKYGDIVGREVHDHVMAHWNEGNQTCACLYCKVFGHKKRFYAGLKRATKSN